MEIEGTRKKDLGRRCEVLKERKEREKGIKNRVTRGRREVDEEIAWGEGSRVWIEEQNGWRME